MYVCMYVYIYIHVCMCIYIHVCMCVYIYTHLYHIFVCVYIQLYTQIYGCKIYIPAEIDATKYLRSKSCSCSEAPRMNLLIW